MPTALYGAETWNMAVAEEVKYNRDEVSEECVWINAYGTSEKRGGAKENWCYERIGWSSKAVC